MLRKRSGFTLIELLVVVIIVAILAGVGIPLLSANIIRSRASEAESALGTIRTGMRAYFGEHDTYVGAALPDPTDPTDEGNLGVMNDDLDGRWFGHQAYTIQSALAASYCVAATGNTATDTAPEKAEVAGVVRSIDETGAIFRSGDCT